MDLELTDRNSELGSVIACLELLPAFERHRSVLMSLRLNFGYGKLPARESEPHRIVGRLVSDLQITHYIAAELECTIRADEVPVFRKVEPLLGGLFALLFGRNDDGRAVEFVGCLERIAA